MLCSKVSNWVLSHGAGEVPSQWRGHIDECETCRELIAQIGALDGALAVDDVPDPGTAYWDGLAPGVERRIDAVRDRRAARAVSPRWAWIGRWAPAIGVAALAILVARELSIPPTVTVPLETDLSVTANREAGVSPDDAGQVLPTQPGPTGTTESRSKESAGERPAMRAAAPATESRPTMSAGASGGDRDVMHSSEPASPSTVAGLPNPQESQPPASTVSDTPLWPDRRVTIMGEIDSSRLRESADDESNLADQGAAAVAEKVAEFAGTSAETLGTFAEPNRLESPQTFRAQGPSDTPNVTADMRRLDELLDLRRQIGIIQSIAPADRTEEQNERLCAMWYRVGMIATETNLVDSAITQLGQCLQVLDGRDRENWEDRSTQLKNRRATLLP